MSGLFIVTTLLTVLHPQSWSQQITSQAPPRYGSGLSTADAQSEVPNAPLAEQFPDALIHLPEATGEKVTIESDTQSEHDKIAILHGSVDIHYGDRRLQADHVEYDSNTGDVTATGHLLVTGGPNRERIEASRGTLNLRKDEARLFDVKGSVGMSPRLGTQMVYSTSAPFLFSGRMVVRTGPTSYDLYEGTVTSCQLPKPDWILTSAHFSLANEQAKGYNSVFHLLGVPLVYLPYVTHAADASIRESGFLLPTVGQSSTKGLILGEQIYMVLGPSMDLTVGAEYYSLRGFAQDASFRYKGHGLDFARVRYSGLLDRRSGTANQGGEDLVVDLRHDFNPTTRVAGDVEYLSSYIYREAFTDNFNQAVNSDIVSTVYGSHSANGIAVSILADRYQGIKLIAQGTTPQQQVRIFHAPEALVDSTEHRLGTSPLEWSLESSLAGLKRTQPNFATGGIVERVDFHPEVAAPFSAGGWRFRPALAVRETAYSRSFHPTFPNPTENQAPISRSDVEFSFSGRAPVIERTFQPTKLQGVLGQELKHTLEPEVTYRLTKGVTDFRHILRFDSTDIVSNTNELEYGLTQRLFRRRGKRGSCGGDQAGAVDQPEVEISHPASRGNDGIEPGGGLNPDPTISAVGHVDLASADTCGNDELISWRLTQRYFFDPRFGRAIVNGRRNIFETTLDLSGVAFLTEPRNISPLISRLRFRSSAHTDIEWDFDLDTGAKRFTSSNVFLDAHSKNGLFGALSYARLDAPGRFYTESATPTSVSGVTTAVSDFDQLRLLLGWGSPLKPGLSVAANSGLDLKSLYGATGMQRSLTGAVTTITVYPALMQYATVQANYNWNCCGLQMEYRKFELGSVRNEGSYRFNFTLANIGSAGNLKRAERLF